MLCDTNSLLDLKRHKENQLNIENSKMATLKSIHEDKRTDEQKNQINQHVENIILITDQLNNIDVSLKELGSTL